MGIIRWIRNQRISILKKQNNKTKQNKKNKKNTNKNTNKPTNKQKNLFDECDRTKYPRPTTIQTVDKTVMVKPGGVVRNWGLKMGVLSLIS